MPSQETALAARVQRLEDVDEIRRLLQEYADCLDAADFAAYAGLFAEDGELVAKLGQARGRAAIEALLEETIGPTVPTRRTAFHLVGNPTIAVDGDTATSRVLWAYITHDDAGTPIILQLGHYRDRLVREHGRWRFGRREISRDLGVSPLAQGDTDGR